MTSRYLLWGTPCLSSFVSTALVLQSTADADRITGAVKGGIGEHIDDITQDQELNFGKVCSIGRGALQY